MHNKIIEGFKTDFLKIKEKGFIESHRLHNTGIGKTFEDLIGIYENNNRLADYKGILELKSQRELSNSLITLFTLVPTFPENAMAYIRDTYGTIDKEFPNRKIIHSTAPHSKFNSYKEVYGFKLELDESRSRIFLKIKNLQANQIESIEIFWNFQELRKIVESKCDYIAYITAKTKRENGREFFHFTDATILSGLNFDKFLRLVKEDIIVFDIRYGVYRSGKKKGQSHDHGPAFRIAKRKLDHAFEIMKL